jgi:hypothetical protein
MERENDKLEKIIHLLRRAEPVLISTDEIEEVVIERISKRSKRKTILSGAVDLLFSWIYIGCVRRSMVAVSIVMVALFIWQQAILMKQINYLSSQAIFREQENISDEPEIIEKKLMMYKLSGKRFPVQYVTISKKQMDLLLESVNDLEGKYNNLIYLIQDDPELKKYIENKITELNKTKVKL